MRPKENLKRVTISVAASYIIQGKSMQAREIDFLEYLTRPGYVYHQVAALELVTLHHLTKMNSFRGIEPRFALFS